MTPACKYDNLFDRPALCMNSPVSTCGLVYRYLGDQRVGDTTCTAWPSL